MALLADLLDGYLAENRTGSKPKSVSFRVSARPIPFPKEWKRDMYPAYSTEREVASKTYSYCESLLWSDGPDTDVERRIRADSLNSLCVDSETRLALAEEWAFGARALLDEIKSPSDVDEQMERRIAFIGGPLPKRVKCTVERMSNAIKKSRAVTQYGSPRISPVSVLKANVCDVNMNALPVFREGAFVYSGHPNDIYRLRPSASWELYVDESGTDESFLSGADGIVAAVLCDKTNPLPDQPQLHASTDFSEENLLAGDKAIESILHNGNAGVLALPVKALRSSTGWAGAVASVIDLVMRILPLDRKGKYTSLVVYVEGRSPYCCDADFCFMRDACRFALAQSFPERADAIRLDIRVMDKGHPMNAYPDLVANTCYAGGRLARKRLAMTGWQRTCHLDFSAKDIGAALECFHDGRIMPEALWNSLLVGYNPEVNRSIVDAMMERFGDEASRSVAIWRCYLDYALSHLESKAVQTGLMVRQVAWLDAHRPSGEKLPPRLELAWLSARLAAENHIGDLAHAEMFSRLYGFAESLFEECAPNSVQAILDVAVAETNAFRFGAALDLVEKWLGKVGIPAVPGLNRYGRLLSSKGQCLAFLGRNIEAIDCFREAIAVFRKLADPKERMDELMHTAAYLLLSQMDCADIASDDLRKTVSVYLAGEKYADDECLKGIAAYYAHSISVAEKYFHHLMLRLMAYNRGYSFLREPYIAEKAHWKTGEGHPWELVEFYRGTMLDDANARVERYRKAYGIACNGGPTLQVIAAVVAGALFLEGDMQRDEYLSKVRALNDFIPDLGEARKNALLSHADHPMTALDLAKAVLPFNFR